MSTPKTGIILDEDIDTYHSTPAFSNSRLKDFDRYPALYKGRYIDGTVPRRAQTQALSVGTALDLMLLEGVAAYHKKIAVKPAEYTNEKGETKPWSGNAKVCQAWVDRAESSGHTVISAADAGLIEEMARTAYADPDIAALLEQGRPGVTWRADFGFAFGQCRTDWYNADGCVLPSTGEATGPYFIELKSARSLLADDYGTFEKDFVNLGYHKQVALYREIIREVQTAEGASGTVDYVRCFIIVVDKTELPQAAAFELTPRALDLSHRQVFKTLEKLQNCYDSGVWPGRPTGVQRLELPGWYEKKLEEKL